MLLGKGVTAWQRVVARLTPVTAPDMPGTACGAAAELVHVLAWLAVALAGT